ncbi:hypothetical protein OO006_04360 [Prosthecochloris sp. SCSIO W1101]|uniref:hypothetical protein n=1 Tax=Prosthecochloris sp. SCSIO W1101 TaxID=2992242 RepID=UPI00223D24ED|nr:hypothetical protein [Prosthecochloris sp. SCSIO W1101]UZJ42214.1 hypothetical protein OO006_04360 [Prosthecochloris sp. SCSIO W1101]
MSWDGRWSEGSFSGTELTAAMERLGHERIESTPEQLWEAVYRGRTGIESMSLDRMYDEGRLYQDANGTTPVTGVEQPVGLMLDGSQRLRLGPELVTNGRFDSGTTGWSSSAEATITTASGKLCVQRKEGEGTGNARAYQSIQTTEGRLYAIAVTIEHKTNTNAVIINGAAELGRIGWAQNDGTYEIHVIADMSHFNVSLYVHGNEGSCLSNFENVTVREVLGNHPHQPTDINRPVLSSRVNGLKNTEDLSAGGWSKSQGATVTGTNVLNLPNAGSRSSQNWITNAPVGTTAKGSIVLSGTGTVRLNIARATGGGGVYENTAIDVALTSTPTRYDVEHTIVNEGQVGFYLQIIRSSISTATQVTVTKADLRYANDGVDLPEYQRVGDVDTTPGDYDWQNYPMYLAFNGTNQNLQVTGMQPDVDEVFVGAAIRKERDEGVAQVMELSRNHFSNEGTFALYAPSSTATGKILWRSKGSSPSDAGYSVLAPVSFVVVGIGRISENRNQLYINGRSIHQGNAEQGTGTYGNHDLYIGSRAGTSLFYTGRLYGLALVFDNPPDDVIATIEHTLNQNAKIHV